MPGNFVSDQTIDFPVSTCTLPFARVRYAFWRSYEGISSNQAGKDFLAWKYEGAKFVFALCGGVSSSFSGQIAARFLGEKLIDWLWKLNIGKEKSEDVIQAGLIVQLKTWRKAGQRFVESYAFPDSVSQTDQASLEKLRKSQGSETTFVCGQVNGQPGVTCEATFAWVGNPYLFVYDDREQPLTLPFERDETSSWSTIRGLEGKIGLIKFTPSQKIGRILAFSDGLSQAGDRLASMENQELQGFIEKSVCTPASDDISVIDLYINKVSNFPEPEKFEGFSQQSGEVSEDDLSLDFSLPEGIKEGLPHPQETNEPVEPVTEAPFVEEVAPNLKETRTEEPSPLDFAFPRPVTSGSHPSKRWVSQAEIKIHISRGNQLGEYLLEWSALSGVHKYEVQESHNEKEYLSTQTGNNLLVEHPAPGYHTYRVRDVMGDETAAWNTVANAALYVPEPIITSPENVRVKALKNKTVSIHWEALKNKTVEEYRVYELGENDRKLVGTVGDVNQCVIQPTSLTGRLSFTVCAVNWSGEGPASKIVVFDPTPKKSIFYPLVSILMQRPKKEKPVAEKETKLDIFRCRTRDEVCLEVTRRLKKSGVHMTGLQVEEKNVSTDEFRSIDHRNTTQLISVYLEKGPEYRLIIYGSKGEQWPIPITFDRRTWNYILTFGPVKKKN